MFILTDFPKFPASWKTATAQGEARSSLAGARFLDLFRLIPDIRKADVIVLHDGASQAFAVILFFMLLPFLRKPLIVVDVILRKPKTFPQRLHARLKRLLLKRVDHFVHYFRDLAGYETYFGISPARSSYVPFKANIFNDPRVATASAESGDYIFTAGQSLRDFDTFLAAVSQTTYPSAMSRYSLKYLGQHGSRFSQQPESLPPNVALLDDNGSADAWFTNLRKARVVVITTLRESLCASGISTYLDAMLLKKCVILTRGPGASDVLTDEAILVPPEDPAALAQAIQKVWEDATLREAVAVRGQRYAASLGGEAELLSRILDQVVRWHSQRVTKEK